LHRIGNIEDADLLPILGDQANLWNRDLVIDAVTFWCSDSRLPPN
jgi:hypothetical protein